MPENRFYFAYGSNMIETQMKDRAPAARLVGPAALDGYEFFIAACGHASISAVPGKQVHGLLWKITPACEASLDGKEESYYKSTVRVETKDGSHDALVYIAKAATAGQNRYKERWPQIIAAAKAHNFPAAYLAELRRFE